MRTNNINRDAALIGVSSPKQVTLSVLAALNAGKISRAVNQFDEHFKFTDHALGLEFVEVMAQNQPGLPAEVRSRATGFCRRAPGRWYKGRFFRYETFGARLAVKWLHRSKPRSVASC
jgi:hypothetical protein